MKHDCWLKKSFRKIFRSIVLALTFVVLCQNFYSCQKWPDVTIDNISIDGAPTINLRLGQTGKLDFRWNGSHTVTPTFTWESSNPNVLEIDGTTGEYTAKSIGECTVKVTNDQSGIGAECQVNVSAIEVEDIRVSPTATTLLIGEEIQLSATITPEDATYKDFTWSSSSTEIATVDENGKVTAVKDGDCFIYATTPNGKKANCKVTVKPIVASGISLNFTEKTLLIGEEFILEATITPENTTYTEINWSSSDSDIANVDTDGKVTAIKVGTCTIYAQEKNGKYATCAITVSPIEVETIYLDITEKSLFVGEMFTISATVTPDNATYKEVTWVSSDTEIASVDSMGNVSALKDGICNITATCKNGKYATCVISVFPIEVETITLDITEYTLEEEEEFTITATITPENATYKEVEWISSDYSIASVDENGKVIAIKEGECFIYAKTSNNKEAECKVTVKPISVKEIKFNSSRIKLMVGDTMQAAYTITPSNAKIINVQWHIDDETVASVSNEGIVTGHNIGTTKLTITINGEHCAECEVAVCSIEEFVSLQFGSSATSSINGYITGSIACFITNSSSQSIVANSIQLIDSASGVAGNKMNLNNATVDAGATIGYTITIRVSMYKPIFRWTYTHDGKEYTIDLKFNR